MEDKGKEEDGDLTDKIKRVAIATSSLFAGLKPARGQLLVLR